MPAIAGTVQKNIWEPKITRQRMLFSVPSTQEIIYPDSDGEPMADNTRQYEVMVTLKGGISALFADRTDVFVAGNLLWYPVEGDNKIRLAPDVMVAFGRPPGHRGSYQQWRENNISPQVVFEILSPGNRAGEMSDKFIFYEQYGVAEYYIYDPDRGTLEGWLRQNNQLNKVSSMKDWVSPRLEIRFHLEDRELVVYRPDGHRFETYLELAQRAEESGQRAEKSDQRAEVERQRADSERQRAEVERQRAEKSDQRAEVERQRANAEHQRAEESDQRAEVERQRAERLVERLRILGINPNE